MKKELTPWNRIYKKLIFLQFVNNIFALLGIHRLSTVFTPHQWALS
jgi:hypothetical protein